MLDPSFNSPFDTADYSFLESSRNHALSPIISHLTPIENDFDFGWSQEMKSPVPDFISLEGRSKEKPDDWGSWELYGLFDFPQAKKKIVIHIEIDDDVYEVWKGNSGERFDDEDGNSTSTKEAITPSTHEAFSIHDGDSIQKDQLLGAKNEEEYKYLQKISNYLMESVKEVLSCGPKPKEMAQLLETITSKILYEKELMISMENKLIKDLVNKEMENLRLKRPVEVKITKKKYERPSKGKKHHSAYNHFNENYVSNVFRFAKDYYTEDNELRKLASERGVSATGFRKLTRANLDDDIFVRKAKVRIVASGSELVNNVEFWMQRGYFENCDEPEKFVVCKERAVANLALDRLY